MARPRFTALLRGGREELIRLATASPALRRQLARIGQELSRVALIGEVVSEARAQRPSSSVAASGQTPSDTEGPVDVYDGSYFGVGRDPSGDRQGRSGYARYDRISSNADIAAYLLWRNFRFRRSLDVGCARGFLVEALRELGLEAYGCDASPFAVEHAAPGARGYVRLGDPLGALPYEDGAFELVSVLETLEHLPPEAVPQALGELRRVCRGICYATIPSFGPNPAGPDGHFEGKVRPERLEHYRSLGPSYGGPVPREDLEVDVEGRPVEGHLTIASFAWWTARFAEAGFDRWADVERRLHADLAPAGLSSFWNLYVFAVPEAPLELATPREPTRSLPELGLEHPLYEHAAAQAAVAEEG